MAAVRSRKTNPEPVPILKGCTRYPLAPSYIPPSRDARVLVNPAPCTLLCPHII